MSAVMNLERRRVKGSSSAGEHAGDRCEPGGEAVELTVADHLTAAGPRQPWRKVGSAAGAASKAKPLTDLYEGGETEAPLDHPSDEEVIVALREFQYPAMELAEAIRADLDPG
jgi:hypothetical protein